MVMKMEMFGHVHVSFLMHNNKGIRTFKRKSISIVTKESKKSVGIVI